MINNELFCGVDHCVTIMMVIIAECYNTSVIVR